MEKAAVEIYEDTTSQTSMTSVNLITATNDN